MSNLRISIPSHIISSATNYHDIPPTPITATPSSPNSEYLSTLAKHIETCKEAKDSLLGEWRRRSAHLRRAIADRRDLRKTESPKNLALVLACERIKRERAAMKAISETIRVYRQREKEVKEEIRKRR